MEWVTQLSHHATKQAVVLQFICHAASIDCSVCFRCWIHKSRGASAAFRCSGLLNFLFFFSSAAVELNIWELAAWRTPSAKNKHGWMNPLGLKKKERDRERESYLSWFSCHSHAVLCITSKDASPKQSRTQPELWVWLQMLLVSARFYECVWTGSQSWLVCEREQLLQKSVRFCVQNCHLRPPDWTAIAINNIWYLTLHLQDQQQ